MWKDPITIRALWTIGYLFHYPIKMSKYSVKYTFEKKAYGLKNKKENEFVYFFLIPYNFLIVTIIISTAQLFVFSLHWKIPTVKLILSFWYQNSIIFCTGCGLYEFRTSPFLQEMSVVFIVQFILSLLLLTSRFLL